VDADAGGHDDGTADGADHPTPARRREARVVTTPHRPTRSSPLARFGPLVAIAAVIAVLAGIDVAGRDRRDAVVASAPAGEAGVEVPPTFEVARERGLEVDFGDRCDPATGRLRIPTVYAPACVPVFRGDNGGGTHRGVTADTVRVAYYVARPDADLTAALAGIVDDEAAVTETLQRYTEFFNALYETYGRRVEVVRYQAKGAANDPVAARADAIAVAEELGAFASIGGPALTAAYAEQLAQAGVLCIGCGFSSPDSTHQANAPHLWGTAPTPEQFLELFGDYLVARLLNRPAAFAGDPALRERTRRFGVIHFELDPPVFSEVAETARVQGEQRGWVAAARETYLLDLAKAPERATTIIARMKEAGVTTVVFLGDPIMPIHLTAAATAQNYFPEWVIAGTAYTDTSVFGRRYDQRQWAHAFGVSPLGVRMPRTDVDAWRLHEWYFGEPPAARTTAPVLYANLQLLFAGIHYAGPSLSPDTFREGMFRAPPAGGGPTAPYVSFGDRGFYRLLDGGPRPDYLGIDDVVEIWWDPDAVGPDETDVVGPGLWRYADGGRRFLPGQMPSEPPRAFVVEGSVTGYTAETRPATDRAPDYPPPPGAPGATR
jgi:hypothetical protein